MPWKKTWPTELKDKLRTDYGLKDKDIAALEAYGSIDEFEKDPKKVLKAVKKDDMKKTLKTAGLW